MKKPSAGTVGGDEVVQEEAGEGCDDGNHKNLDGCNATGKIEQPK